MSAHTPGPWVYGDWINRAKGVHDGAGWVEVWSQSDPDNCLPIVACKHQDELANARLISAAPELLEALIRLLDDEDEHLTLQGRKNLARAAIAKAGGAA